MAPSIRSFSQCTVTIHCTSLVIWLLLAASSPACRRTPPSSQVRYPIPDVLNGNDNIKYGYPGGNGRILVKKYYVILHEDSLRVPGWVAYHLTRHDLEGTSIRKNRFRPDPDIPVGSRAELIDYKKSGYDRGHMAPVGDFKRDE